MLPESLPDLRSKFECAERLFAPGTIIAIREPFYKIMADGTHAVRVDNPNEVCL